MIELDYLSKLFDLCSKKGVESFEIDNIKFKLRDGYAPKKRIRGNAKEELQDFQTSEEAALFWSSQPPVGV